jgi:hypothetical protein
MRRTIDQPSKDPGKKMSQELYGKCNSMNLKKLSLLKIIA